VPYRDMYDTSFPGTFLLYGAITALTGYTDLACRLTDVVLLLYVSWLTWRLLGGVSRVGALVSVLCFADYMLSEPTFALQRDYLGLVLVLTSLLVVVDLQATMRWRMILAGVLLGMAASIKPHLLVGAPIVWLYGASLSVHRATAWKCLMHLAVGAGLIWCVVIAWMYWQGSLEAFVDMVQNGLPLYMQVDGGLHEVRWQWPGWWHVLDSVLYLTHLPEAVVWVIVLLGTLASGSLLRHWKLMLLLLCLTAAYRLYVLLGMKGWNYHFIPAQYFFFCTIALFFVPCGDVASWRKFLHALLMFLMALALVVMDPNWLLMDDKLFARLHAFRQSWPLHTKEQPGKKALVAYLSSHASGACVEPRVQSTYGPVFPALLQLRLKPCTPFQLSQMFYLHVRDPYIRQKRSEYIQALCASRPRLILDDGQFAFYNRFAENPVTTSPGTLRSSFDAYEELLERGYVLDFDNKLPPPDRVLVYRRQLDDGG
jgi:hypothetical protein